MPKGVTALHDGELPVFMVHPPRVKEEATDEAAATSTEPEVIGEKKEESAEE